jgi:VWFA-related protein
VCIISVWLVAASAGLFPQQEPSRPTFAARTDLIQLDVSVLDGNRVPVRDLTTADFTVRVDGKPQPIVAFDAVDLPGRDLTGAAWRRDVAPDVATNRADAQRIVVLVMDDAHTPFDPGVNAFARRIGQAVVDQLGPADRAAVVYTFARKSGQEFTSDRARLRAAVNRFTPAGTAPMASPFSAERGGSLSSGPSRSGICLADPKRGDCLIEALLTAADILRGSPATRKTLVLVSPVSYHVAPDSLDGLDTADVLTRLFTALQQANINVYEFDPRGLRLSYEPDWGMLAENTGGRAITNSNEPWSLAPQVFRENSSYYVLGVQPADGRQDGRVHRITVRVSRPGVEVRSRTAYVAPPPPRPGKPARGPAPSGADRAIAGGLPAGDLPMRLTAAPMFVAGDRRARLAIAAGLALPSDAPVPPALALVVAAFTDTWKQAGTVRQSFTIDPREPGRSAVLDFTSRLDLPPGRYELRAALEDTTTGRAGSAFLSVIVPDFDKSRLVLSGATLGMHASPIATGSPLAGVLPFAPTTRREFDATDAIDAFVQVRQGGGNAMTAVSLVTRVLDGDGDARWSETTTLTPAQFGAGRQANVRTTLPLARLEPGEYLLSIEATAGGTTDRREVRFGRRAPRQDLGPGPDSLH